MKNKPIFYPSVSSVAKNRLTALEHIEILFALNHPNFLISAYDIFHFNDAEQKVFKELYQNIIQKDTDLIIDSGMYERVWARDDTWSFENYKTTVEDIKYNFVFNFDEYINPKDIPLENIVKSIKNSKIVGLSPILHTNKITDLPDLCLEVAKLDEVEVIAIPERELGNGIVEGINTISKIRQKLSTLKKYTKIHILGTGNPISLLLYSAFGVDSFDGLDWCQTVVDYDSATLHHSLQLDFYAHQSKFGNMKEISYNTRLLAHNLEFYLLWMEEINKEIANNSIQEMLKYYVPKSILSEILEAYGIYSKKSNK